MHTKPHLQKTSLLKTNALQMNRQIKFAWLSVTLLTAMLLGFALTAKANTPTGNIVVQIPQTFYHNPVRMLHPYMDYWHNRGEALSRSALASFQPLSLASNSCQQTISANALIVLEPNMFYNAQLRVFHSQITAKVYTNNEASAALTNPDLVVTGIGQQLGELSYQAEYFMEKSYAKALAQVSEKLAQSDAFKQSLARNQSKSYQALCQSIDTVTQQKLYF